MGHSHSTPQVSQIWSNIFEPVVVPRGECQNVRTTYNIRKTPPNDSDSHQPHDNQTSEPKTPTTRFFDLWSPSNLFNAVQPLRNDYKVRAKIQKCLSLITRPSPTITTDLQLPMVINIYLARRNSPKIDDAQLSAYFEAVYGANVSPECISKVGGWICDFDVNTRHQTYAQPYEHLEKLCGRLSGSDRDRSIPAHFKQSVQNLILFMDSVWLSMTLIAQEATENEWRAYAEANTRDGNGEKHHVENQG